jgi:hypothetical protein
MRITTFIPRPPPSPPPHTHKRSERQVGRSTSSQRGVWQCGNGVPRTLPQGVPLGATNGQVNVRSAECTDMCRFSFELSRNRCARAHMALFQWTAEGTWWASM